MASFRVVFALCLLALSCVAGLDAARPSLLDLPCRTSQGCEDGPVYVHFEGSDSCAPAFAKAISSYFNKGPKWPAGQCNTDMYDISVKWSISNDGKGLYVDTWYQPTCNGPQERSKFQHLGLCSNSTFINQKAASFMVLASAKEQIPTGDLNPHPAALPFLDPKSGMRCPVGTPCGYSWQTSYSDSACTQPIGNSFSSPLRTVTGESVQLNGCYTLSDWRGNPTNNVAFRCNGGMISEVQYQGSGCDSTIASSVGHPLNACIDRGFGKYTKYFCSSN
jgi:hypothetical protein